jgi:methionine-gamma-lyase
MLLRSMETLHLRVERQQENAQAVAHFLRQHPNVEHVISAFSEDLNAEQREVATAQTAGGGSMLAFRVKGARKEAFKVLNALRIFGLAVSLGSTESLAEHPASMTHAGVPPEEKELHGITENLIRLSIGVEHVSDLIADLQQALATLNTPPLAPSEIPTLSGTGKN